MFALTLVPTCMFAPGMINVLEHYGALKAARKLPPPLLKPLMDVPGTTGLVMIGSLQSTDVGAGILTGAHIAILAPAIYFMGSAIQYAGRILGVVGTRGNLYPVMFAICILNGFMAMFVMNILV